MSDKGFFAIGITGGTDLANSAIAASGGAELSAVENDLQMKLIPAVFWEKFF